MLNNFAIEKTNKMPAKNVINLARAMGLKPRIKTGKETVIFKDINTERTNFGVVIPAKK